jgi:hypothetical protein
LARDLYFQAGNPGKEPRGTGHDKIGKAALIQNGSGKCMVIFNNVKMVALQIAPSLRHIMPLYAKGKKVEC